MNIESSAETRNDAENASRQATELGLADAETPGDPKPENLEEGELYVVRKGHLEHLPRNDTEGMRRTRITEDAYHVAAEIGSGMRNELQGYKPDVSLVISALLLSHADHLETSKDIVRKFVIGMFSQLN